MTGTITEGQVFPTKDMTADAIPPRDIPLVIGASAVGTIFEWYDFFIYGALGAILSKTFFPTGNPTLEILLFWLVFAIGFGFRPLGAVLFGYLGDRLGRKYTFLVTVTLMGIATAGVGLIPSAASIGYWAPALVLFLRVLQGLALGGEYGGAAVYVAEHAPPEKRGFYTSFIQAGVVGGFVLSLIVVLICKTIMGDALWADWGWRVPFVLSLLLLAVSLWMRVKLSESPVFQAMKEEGELSGNPLAESFRYPGNKKRIFVALFGVAAGLTVIWYTAYFSALNFLTGPMRVKDTVAQLLLGVSGLSGMAWMVYFGRLSDRIGRKKPLVVGHAVTLVVLFPLFWGLGSVANPGLANAAKVAPVVISGPDCRYDPFATKQPTECGKVMGVLSAKGVKYEVRPASTLEVSVGDLPAPGTDQTSLETALAAQGYNLDAQVPTAPQIALMLVMLIGLGALTGATYGPVAALLAEMFPARVRYSSLSIPYHIGSGYFGGFLPLISTYIAAKAGNPYAGLWYTWIVTLVAFVVCMWGLSSGPPRDFADDPA